MSAEQLLNAEFILQALEGGGMFVVTLVALWLLYIHYQDGE